MQIPLSVVNRGAAAMPRPALVAGLRAALGDLRVALCAHRVGPPAPGRFYPNNWMDPADLDSLVEMLRDSRRRPVPGWLTVALDDGYADAVEWVASRARRWPEVEFLLFVCPEKTERRAGFRWDLAELALQTGRTPAQAAALVDAPWDPDGENRREDLRSIAEHPSFRLASVGAIRAAAAAPNVRIGNHGDHHYPANAVPLERFAEDVAGARTRFERLFGPERHFALPYGSRWAFDGRHVDALRAGSQAIIWSTEARPYGADERRPGAVLPRFPVGSTLHPHAHALRILRRALALRASAGGARSGATAAPPL